LTSILFAVASAASGEAPVAVEYRHAEWNHYFVTTFQDEIANLDGGAFGGTWQRTGQAFNVFAVPGTATLPMCRYFSAAFAPRSSHFYTPFASECASLTANPDWQYEGVAFHVEAMDAGGGCSASRLPLFRVYNNGAGGAPNHRYTTSVTTLEQMLADGWIFEGHGVTRAFACVPQAAPAEPELSPIRIETFSFRGYPITVYLPPRYSSSAAPLPVIYAFDSEQRFGRLTEVLTAGGRDIVFVGIGNISGGQRFVDFDLPGARPYFAMLTQELVPFVERMYRVDPAKRSLSGHSLSGFFTVLAMLMEDPAHRYFANYIAADSSFQFSQAANTNLIIEAYQKSPTMAVKLSMSASPGGAGPMHEMATQLQNTFDGITILQKDYSESHVGMDVPSFFDAVKFIFDN
jgi:predicted alpha/beta superfamily hydrolase